MYIQPGKNIAASTNKKKQKKVKRDFISDEIKQCPNLQKVRKERNNNKFDDLKIEDITKSCEDLAIDG